MRSFSLRKEKLVGGCGCQTACVNSTRNFLTFVNTTAIACHQNPEALVVFLPVCNSSRVYKRQKITSTLSHDCLLSVAVVSHEALKNANGNEQGCLTGKIFEFIKVPRVTKKLPVADPCPSRADIRHDLVRNSVLMVEELASSVQELKLPVIYSQKTHMKRYLEFFQNLTVSETYTGCKTAVLFFEFRDVYCYGGGFNPAEDGSYRIIVLVL